MTFTLLTLGECHQHRLGVPGYLLGLCRTGNFPSSFWVLHPGSEGVPPQKRPGSSVEGLSMIRETSKYRMIPGMPFSGPSICPWKIVHGTLTLNWSCFILNVPWWFMIVCASMVASFSGSCWYACFRSIFARSHPWLVMLGGCSLPALDKSGVKVPYLGYTYSLRRCILPYWLWRAWQLVSLKSCAIQAQGPIVQPTILGQRSSVLEPPIMAGNSEHVSLMPNWLFWWMLWCGCPMPQTNQVLANLCGTPRWRQGGGCNKSPRYFELPDTHHWNTTTPEVCQLNI